MEYCPGCLNSADDAIDDSTELLALSGPSFRLLDEILAATGTDEEMGCLRQQRQDVALGAPWHTTDGFLLHGKCLFIPAQHDLRQQVIELAYATGHEGI